MNFLKCKKCKSTLLIRKNKKLNYYDLYINREKIASEYATFREMKIMKTFHMCLYCSFDMLEDSVSLFYL